MFIRDSSGNPNQISRIFVRDASGIPNEISKIYVRDASGTPILVFDNTVSTFSCPVCDTGIAYYYNIGTSSPSTSYGFYLKPRTSVGCSPIAQSGGSSGNNGYLPPVAINKAYWSKIGVQYDVAVSNKTTTNNTYYFSTEQTFSCSPSDQTCLCNWLNNIVIDGTSGELQIPNKLNQKLLDAFNSITNYPPIPGYILTDYKTTGKKSSVWALANIPQIEWNNHGNEVNVDNYFDVCQAGTIYSKGVYETGTGIAPRNSNIYPMYQRSVWLKKNRKEPPNSWGLNWFCGELTETCGQEPCLGFYGDFYLSWSLNNCWNWGAGGFSWFFYRENPDVPLNHIICQPDSNNGVDTGGWGNDFSGSTTVGTQTWCVNNTSGDPWCVTYDCTAFFGANGWDITDWNNINPYSWLLAKEKTNTSKIYPTVQVGADENDCCIDCLYGPIESKNTTIEEDVCRNIYQIPPINTLNPQNQKFSFFSEPSSESEAESIGIGTGVAFNTNNDTSSTSSNATVRFVLPAYLTLSKNLVGKIIKMKQDNTTLESFINSGPYSFETDGDGNLYYDLSTYNGANGTLNEDEFSIWKGISGFLGFNIKDAIDGFDTPLEQKYRTFISSTSFYYEENRFDATARLSSSGHPDLPPKGITSVTNSSSQGQYPLLWWNFNGFPTEKHTHYVVIEAKFIAGQNTCHTFLSGDMRQIQLSPRILKNVIKSIHFYPLHTICKELEGVTATDNSVVPPVNNRQVTYAFVHPIFQNYMVAHALQNDFDIITGTSNTDPEGGNGFLDYYSNNLNTLTSDQGGTGGVWNVTSTSQTGGQELIQYFQYGVGTGTKTMYHSCFRLPAIGSYSNFLSKYYAAGTVI